MKTSIALGDASKKKRSQEEERAGFCRFELANALVGLISSQGVRSVDLVERSADFANLIAVI
jgi:hypothetical protein